MVGEMTTLGDDNWADGGHSPLLPDRHPTPGIFVCDIFDAAP